MNKLIFATNNAHKLSEIRSIIGKEFQVLSLADIQCYDDIPETSDTLEGNALQKAQHIFSQYQLCCFADDTGLEVMSLNGEPGVHTARYAYPDRHDPDANTAKLLEQLQHATDRSARFRTVIAYINNEGKEFLFEGIVKGSITTEKRGTKGFGYDPVFIPEGYYETFAELGTETKNQISHRAQAIRQLADFLNQETI